MVDLSQTDLGERVRRLEKYTLPGGQPGPETVTADESTATALTPAPEPAGVGGALAEGQVLADDGELYDHPQDAENAATDYILLGPGTFGSFTIDTVGLTVQGSGRGTAIDSSDQYGTALTVDAADVTLDAVRFLAYQGLTVNFGGSTLSRLTIESPSMGIYDGNGGTLISRCRFQGTDRPIELRGGSIVESCTFDSTGGSSGTAFGAVDCRGRARITDNVVTGQTGGDICFDLTQYGPNVVMTGNIARPTASHRVVRCAANDALITDNVLYNRSNGGDQIGVSVQGTNDIIANNRVDAGVTAIDTTAATTPTLDANLTS